MQPTSPRLETTGVVVGCYTVPLGLFLVLAGACILQVTLDHIISIILNGMECLDICFGVGRIRLVEKTLANPYWCNGQAS